MTPQEIHDKVQSNQCPNDWTSMAIWMHNLTIERIQEKVIELRNKENIKPDQYHILNKVIRDILMEEMVK